MAQFNQQIQEVKEFESLAEAEYNRLKRQYRFMENDRVSLAKSSKQYICQQQDINDNLQSDKVNLVAAIQSTKSTMNKRKNVLMDSELNIFLSTRSKYAKYISYEKEQINEIQEKIVQLNKHVSGLKSKIKTDIEAKKFTSKQNRFISILKNRLEFATKRFNIIVSDNTKLRREIDSLLGERSQFNILWKELIYQLNIGKQLINDLIEQAIITFNQRDEECNKIYALRERGLRNLKSHMSEMCEIQRTLDNEIKLQEFIGVKGQTRGMLNFNATKLMKVKSQSEDVQTRITGYTEMLLLIRQFTGDSKNKKLIAHFIKQEEENFALFKYVNDMNDEIGGLQSSFRDVCSAIDRVRVLNDDRSRKQILTIKDINETLQLQMNSAISAEGSLVECKLIINKLLKESEALFRYMQCDNSSILRLLGEKHDLTADNVILHLRITEKNIEIMLNKVYWIDQTHKNNMRLDHRELLTFFDAISTEPCALCVEKEEIHHVSDGLEMPLNRLDALERLKMRIQENYAMLLHSVSNCHLPAARKIMQKRYQ